MEYIDSRGWRYRVMQGLGTEYKARYKKPDKGGWHCVARLPWRATAEEAEKDLAAYAARHGMKEEREHE
nr:hypothetical protein [Mitsuokella multacida]